MAAAPPSADTDSRSDTRRSLIGIALLVALIVLPIALSLSVSWVDLPWNSAAPAKAAPDWVSLPQVRATTTDGTVVKARVALDVQGSSAKTQLQNNVAQVGLLLEISIAQQTRAQIGSPQGIPRLAQDIRDRLNGYLVPTGEDAPIKSVAIQDLLVRHR
jgi:flagellar basal body-associated protein FliL